MQILTQILQCLMYDRTMALKQWIIYSLAEFHGSNSPSCHKIDPPSWLSSLSGSHQALAYSQSSTFLNDKTPNITICFPLYFRWNQQRQSNCRKPTLLPPLHCSYQILTKVPKFPNLPLAAELLGSYTRTLMVLRLPAFYRKTNHFNSQNKNQPPHEHFTYPLILHRLIYWLCVARLW